MTVSRNVSRHIHVGLTRVQSMGGPLVAVPVSVPHRWGGCTMDGVIVGGTDVPDDYDRACDVEGLAGVIGVGAGGFALVPADEPATTCFLAERNVFLRRLGADSDDELIEAGNAVLDDPATDWEDCGVRETDGPAVLLDSAVAGADLAVDDPDQGGLPDQAPVPVPAGRWSVRAFHRTDGSPGVGVVQLLPAPSLP
ncbi:Imm21 family immunity protein [Streptomyces sp. NBC_00151]|uniref:Imm21 family immunity protein n=1 Tax=Streptomyces sp. NBC_00151 TaxID=2975669 RepID=UPI002DDBE17A|nr:Imm21 family immunity protein [Streptomyces sp. NBC_00151]WRZ43503.1 immunity 21 family protein [Streptomyces sp. NBC_00151]